MKTTLAVLSLVLFFAQNSFADEFITICNDKSFDINIAMGQYIDDVAHVHGWSTIYAGNCRTYTNVTKAYFYVFGISNATKYVFVPPKRDDGSSRTEMFWCFDPDRKFNYRGRESVCNDAHPDHMEYFNSYDTYFDPPTWHVN